MAGFVWLLRLLVLAGICIYVPVEAFDGDAEVGLDDALIQTFDSRLDFKGITSQHPTPPGPPAWHQVTSLGLMVGAPAPSPSSPAVCQTRLLRASRLCPRSRIGDAHSPPQEGVAPRGPDEADALLTASRPAGRAFIFVL